MSKKLLFITSNTSTPWGGSEVLWYKTSLEFLRSGNKVGICIKNWNPLPEHLIELINNGAEVIFIGGNFKPSVTLRFNRKFFGKDILPPYLKSMKDFQADLVVISQGGNSDGLKWMEWSLKNKLPFVTISQAVSESNWPSDETALRMSDCFKSARRNYFVCRANLKTTENQLALNLTNNSKVIFNPFNISYDTSYEYPSSNEYYYLANVARFDFKAKGQDVLCEVMSQQKWRDRNLTIRLYGSGSDQKSLERLISFYQVENQIIFMGYESPEVIWKNNHGLILSSRYEGLPLSLVEAMLAKRFSIVTNVSGNTEVIDDNITGFIAEAPKPEYLDKAMERAWERRHDWENMGKKAGFEIRKIIPKDPIAYFNQDLSSVLK